MSEAPANPRPPAVGLFSVRRELIRDFEGTLRRIAEMGYEGVEPALFGPVPLDVLPEDMRIPTPGPQEFAAMLERVGLRATSLHAPLPEGDVESYVLEYAAALEVDQLVLASFMALPGAGNAHADEAVLGHAIERFGAAADTAERHALSLGFHNHHFEWEVEFADGPAWDVFWKRVDPRVKAEVDVYWAQTAGRDPAAVIEALGPRVNRVHLKDGPCQLGEPQTALGDGKVDIEACARAARHSAWWIVELDECATDMLEALERSLRFLVARGLCEASGRSS